MNRQKVYNRIRKHLLKQGEPALLPPGSKATCAYRAYDPTRKKVLKCAIGCLIPFSRYTPEIEGQGIHMSDVYNALPESVRPGGGSDREFLAALQLIHDTASPELWEGRLDSFASDWELEVQDATRGARINAGLEADLGRLA